jgi:hypothetical protein
MIKLAGSADLLHIINPKLEQVGLLFHSYISPQYMYRYLLFFFFQLNKWLVDWDATAVQKQVLLRALYDAFAAAKQTYGSMSEFSRQVINVLFIQ